MASPESRNHRTPCLPLPHPLRFSTSSIEHESELTVPVLIADVALLLILVVLLNHLLAYLGQGGFVLGEALLNSIHLRLHLIKLLILLFQIDVKSLDIFHFGLDFVESLLVLLGLGVLVKFHIGMRLL